MKTFSPGESSCRRVRWGAALVAGVVIAAFAAPLAMPLTGVAPASAAPMTQCGDLGTVASGTAPQQCELAPGAIIEFVVVAGSGGNGGAGGSGGAGFQGWTGAATVSGGAGGIGGAGGVGGVGAAVSGRYTNTSVSPVTLEVVAGAHGSPGQQGTTAVCNTSTVAPSNIPPQDGTRGCDGDSGSVGGVGGDATISALNSNGPANLIVAAFGGTGGTGGTGGVGGQGGRLDGTPGAAGANGVGGVAGLDGSTDPNPLSAGMTSIANDGTPRITLSTVAPTPVVVPPPPPVEVAPATTTTVAPSTTTVVPTTTVPAPVPDGDTLPDLAAGDSQVLENGVPSSVDVFVENDTQLVLQGNDFALRLRGECEGGCTIATSADGRAVLTLTQQGGANVEGEGFLPGTPVYVWLFSDPQLLGTLTVNDDGTFTGNVALQGIEVGEHTLQVNGTSFDGVARTANLGVLVNAAQTPVVVDDVLPSTGGVAVPMMLVALALLAMGAVAVGRRPRAVGE